jgi:hypothetical protein
MHCEILIDVRAEKSDGAPGRIRTSDLVLRRHTLYPAELRAHATIRFYLARAHAPSNPLAERSAATLPLVETRAPIRFPRESSGNGRMV